MCYAAIALGVLPTNAEFVLRLSERSVSILRSSEIASWSSFSLMGIWAAVCRLGLKRQCLSPADRLACITLTELFGAAMGRSSSTEDMASEAMDTTFVVGKSLFMWVFLPDFIAGTLLKLYHKYFYQPGSKRAANLTREDIRRQRNLCIILATLIILFYNSYQHYISLAPTHYSHLNLTPTCSDSELRNRFRQIAYIYHPDKLGDLTEAEQKIVEIKYLSAKRAYDVLKSPLKRTIYDRMGSSGIGSCTRCFLESDFIISGIFRNSIYYASYMGVNMIFTFFQSGRFGGGYWRLILCLALYALDTALMVGYFPKFFSWLSFGHLPPFQTMNLLRQISFNFLIGLSNCRFEIIELLFGYKDDSRLYSDPGGELSPDAKRELLEESVVYSDYIEASAKASIRAFIEPFITAKHGEIDGDTKKNSNLLKRVQYTAERLAVDNTLVRSDPEFGHIITERQRKQWNILRSVNSGLHSNDIKTKNENIPNNNSKVHNMSSNGVKRRGK